MPLARKEKTVSPTADLPFHVVIPARLDSSRLSGKVLRDLGGIHLFYGTGNRNAFALSDQIASSCLIESSIPLARKEETVSVTDLPFHVLRGKSCGVWGAYTCSTAPGTAMLLLCLIDRFFALD